MLLPLAVSSLHQVQKQRWESRVVLLYNFLVDKGHYLEIFIARELLKEAELLHEVSSLAHRTHLLRSLWVFAWHLFALLVDCLVFLCHILQKLYQRFEVIIEGAVLLKTVVLGVFVVPMEECHNQLFDARLYEFLVQHFRPDKFGDEFYV